MWLITWPLTPWPQPSESLANLTKEDPDTSHLGLLLSLAYSKQMETLLGIMGDTTFSTSYGDYVETLVSEGFTRVLQVPFQAPDPDREEQLEIWWNKEGVLLRFDTYTSGSAPKINRSNFYYNWVTNPEAIEKRTYHQFTSSGGFSGPDDALIWVGSHDGREALRHNLRQLREHGTFLPTWYEAPFLWLLHHQDDSQNYEEVNQSRIALLPISVQTAIQGAPKPPRPEGKTL